MLFYFDSETACGKGVDTLRSALPAHLRDCVYAFSSGISGDSKKDCWEGFTSGRYRIICCTDAAGMGCNVSDVKITVIFECPASLAVVSQRWGRTGRDWDMHPPNALMGISPESPSRWARCSAGRSTLQRPGKGATRAKIEPTLEGFINSGLAATKDERELNFLTGLSSVS
jgi:superfamily II DNA helicase RecQ